MNMGNVIVQEYTCKKPITMIGVEAGVCWGADTTDDRKNYLRGVDCLESGHGRTFEFPDAYLILDGYSARVIREWYTRVGGLPTRLQASTRYIDVMSTASIMSHHRASRTTRPPERYMNK